MGKLKTCVLNCTKDDLIKVISSQSSRYGDKLVEFMDLYGLENLQDANMAQLKEYVSEYLCPQNQNKSEVGK